MHPSANPVETFMKPLGKAMKIANHNQLSEKDTLQQLLNNYRDTPHPATGIPPCEMMFRDGVRNIFPRVGVTYEDVLLARDKDKILKDRRQEKINSSKYRGESQLKVDDTVLLRNFQKCSKFDPIFMPQLCEVLDIKCNGRRVTIERKRDGKIFKRHPDDLRLHHDNS